MPSTTADLDPVRARDARVACGVLLAGVAAAKLQFMPGLPAAALDANFYFHLARHVAEGDGLVTSVSLYHQGLSPLPAPSAIYPLWPLSLGKAGTVVGLERAAAWLPQVLGITALFVAHELGLALSGVLGLGPLARLGRLRVELGHITVLIFATHPRFIWATSTAYSEGLAFLLLFAALLSFCRILPRSRDAALPATGLVLTGALAGLAYLTRYQMAMVVVALVAGLLSFRRSRRAVLEVLWLLVGVGLVCVPQLVHLASFTTLTPRLLLDFAAQHGVAEFPRYEFFVQAPSTLATFADRLAGFVVALDPWRRESYVASWGALAYLPLVAVLVGLLRRSVLNAALASDPRRIAVLSVLGLSGAGLLAPIHAAHMTIAPEWLFGDRHGLPLGLLVVLALAVVSSAAPVALRRVTWLVVGLSLAANLSNTVELARFPYPVAPRPVVRELGEWLDARPSRPTVLAREPQAIAPWTRSNLHWIACDDSPSRTRLALDTLAIDYVVVTAADERCPFAAERVARLERVVRLGAGPDTIDVYRPVD